MVDKERITSICMQLSTVLLGTGQKCFLCFGTLLAFIRDKRLALEQDIDIGVIGAPGPVISAFEGVFQPVGVIRDDSTNEPYNMHFVSSYFKCTVDVFFWKKKNGFYYHTYDHNHLCPASGILPEYEFKGVDADCFDVSPEAISAYQADMRYGRAMSDNGTWQHIVPGIEEECISLPVPFGYGRFFDQAYPHWSIPNAQFGVSEAKHRFTVKSCRGIKWER